MHHHTTSPHQPPPPFHVADPKLNCGGSILVFGLNLLPPSLMLLIS
jgi:hypothetical protein